MSVSIRNNNYLQGRRMGEFNKGPVHVTVKGTSNCLAEFETAFQICQNSLHDLRGILPEKDFKNRCVVFPLEYHKHGGT